MKRSRGTRLAAAGLVSLVMAAGILLGLRSLGIGADDHDSNDEVLTAPIRTKSVDGEIHVVISERELQAGGIGVAALERMTYQDRAPAFGTVVTPQLIAEQRRSYQAAATEVVVGEIAVRAARIEVQRLRPASRDDRIVSAKVLEAAQAAVATEEANARLASDQLRLQEAALYQQWGPIVGKWLIDAAPELDDLLTGRVLLLQVALPAGRFVTRPSIAQIESESGETLAARIVSDMPQANAKFPGQAFYAVTQAAPRLRPGMTVPVAIPVDAPATGLAVPESAVLRWQGKAWVFVALDDDEFARRPIVTDMPTPQGWLVPAEPFADARIVVRGAQLLLSEEIKAQADRGNGP